jgi:hypothetical protein
MQNGRESQYCEFLECLGRNTCIRPSDDVLDDDSTLAPNFTALTETVSHCSFVTRIQLAKFEKCPPTRKSRCGVVAGVVDDCMRMRLRREALRLRNRRVGCMVDRRHADGRPAAGTLT